MTLRPRLFEEEYWFVALSAEAAVPAGAFAMVAEDEGLTLVIARGLAEAAGFTPSMRCRRITLSLVTELEAVGVTAAFSAALAAAGIPANVIAGVHHDHLFVPIERAGQALHILEYVRWP